jgi:hypothetical protein
MKGISHLMMAGLLVLVTTASMAGTKTSMGSHWICTTNASSATTDAEKKSDDKMAKHATSASSAFNAASKNCRDCTKIECEVKK